MMEKVFVIAEAGVNHNGDIEIAKRLVEEAKKAGADAVKFQTFNASNLASKFASKADYQKETTEEVESQLEMLRKLELSREGHFELIEYCKKMGIDFLSSPFDLESIEFLDELGVFLYKIPSGEITNLPYLRKIGQKNKKTILSSGMSNLFEVESAIEVLVRSGLDKNKLTVLHCNTEYPTPMTDVNLLAMKTIERNFQVPVGYSDHTQGIEVAIAAVALGAKVIEKHFTLDNEMKGPDHKASLNPEQLKDMIDAIRNVEQALGDGEKLPSPSETKNMTIARKSIVAKTHIKVGEVFSEENITVKRPGDGLSPMRWDEVLGQKASRDFEEDELVEL